MKVKVKICGVRSNTAAQTAVDAGADYLGFNFVRESKRFIDPFTALELSTRYRDVIKIVGVFQNENVQMVSEIADLVGLDFVQLHGNEDDDYMKKISLPIIKSVADFESDIVSVPEYLLLDRAVRGMGPMIDFDKAKKIAADRMIFFAGGLTPENVVSVIEKVKPYAVDVAGGIESGGREDVSKIREFISNAKGAISL